MDHYQTLGIARGATPDEIKKAYRKLASQHHPDKGGDTAMFQKIEEAYRTLSDPEKRQQYDNPMPQGMHGFPFGFNTNGVDLNNLFGQMFGQHPQQRQQQGQMFRTVVSITLDEACKGLSHILRIQTPTGPKAANIDIPKGIHQGDQIRYDKIIDGATLIVEFKIQPHLRFERKGNDLYANHQISVLDLIVGGSFEFTTLSGKTFEVTVKPQTQPFMQLKIPGQGMPIYNTTTFGDQIILLKPFIPDTIDEEITQSILRAKSR